ncbi:uncharacterized protein LOC110459288 [Mizuhopecten yessoensis]|uniref:uncharacterized protein LOC110459288 n=1 Tax=Mizuhopecten yessoensis TaxID=6573 RepID=UPI000B45AA3E|nr:uncharacterized protein LOC110459288 [Mizuhopecten yessoensis]
MEPGKEIEVVGTCACYCDPITYSTKEHLATLPEDMEVTVGVHSKHQYSHVQFNRVVQELRQLIQLPRVGAVGEIGLDHSVPWEQWAEQSVMLEKILPLVEPRGYISIVSVEIPTCVTSAFSQLYFGFTSMAAKFNNQQSQAVRGINPERVLLETDAPYFARSGTRCSAPKPTVTDSVVSSTLLQDEPGITAGYICSKRPTTASTLFL